MDSRISETIGIVKSVLEENHPDSVVKSAQSGECDFRVSSVGATITATPYGEYRVTEEDVDLVKQRVSEDIDGRDVEHRTDSMMEETAQFDLKS